ncbi:RsiV family protein [Castellaniella sp. S9]|uniref:RsiV family protein n=1 Tax=Castellaniella sp. S9 TaxID=2993652 RepID=UPI0022B381DE|nr:RsiV family protein [Castellaniella sp. S9]
MSALRWMAAHGRSGLAAWACALLLAACAAPSDRISLIPSELDQQTSQDGLFTQKVAWSHVRPGCEGECPKLVVDSLAFPGHRMLTELVDHALATMTWLDQDEPVPYFTIAEYEPYFWRTAGPRDETWLQARTRYRNRHITVVELDASQYRTGMAHGISGTQFLNWDNEARKVLALDDVLVSGGRAAFDEALRRAHARWLQDNPAAREDPLNYDRLWPFRATDNFALTDLGVVAKYQSYQIAPYSSGHPELLVPYTELRDVLRSRYLPPS